MKVPKMIKISAIILILGASLVGSYFIIKNSAPAVEVKQELTEKDGQSPIKDPIQWIEENVLNKIGEIGQLDSPDKSTLDTQSENNLTTAFSKVIFEQIKSKNEQGLTEKDGQAAIFAPNEEILSQKLFNDFLNKDFIEYYADKKVVDESRIKISQDNSKKNQIEYLKQLQAIRQNRFGDFNKTNIDILEEIIEDNNFSNAKRMVDIYKNLIDDYYQITVPNNWTEYHKHSIGFLSISYLIYNALANFNEDQITAYLAAESILKLEKMADGLKNFLIEEMTKNNLYE